MTTKVEKWMHFFDCRCKDTTGVKLICHFFDSLSESEAYVCSTEGCQSTETLIKYGHVITITANSLTLVITTLATIQQPLSFDPPSHQAHPLLCFRPDWFNSSHSLIYGSSGPTLSLASYLPLLWLPFFCCCLSRLRPSHAFKGEECIDRLRFYRVCALWWESKRWRSNRKIPGGTEEE